MPLKAFPVLPATAVLVEMIVEIAVLALLVPAVVTVVVVSRVVATAPLLQLPPLQPRHNLPFF